MMIARVTWRAHGEFLNGQPSVPSSATSSDRSFGARGLVGVLSPADDAPSSGIKQWRVHGRPRACVTATVSRLPATTNRLGGYDAALNYRAGGQRSRVILMQSQASSNGAAPVHASCQRLDYYPPNPVWRVLASDWPFDGRRGSRQPMPRIRSRVTRRRSEFCPLFAASAEGEGPSIILRFQ